MDLLGNLKAAEEKLDTLHDEYEDKIAFAKVKIQEMMDLNEQLEHGQVIYIPHRNDKIDVTLAHFINRYPERKQMKIMFLRESEGVYKFGQKRIYVKVEKGDKILVRVGGGYMGIEQFITQYTGEEVDKINRKDVVGKFFSKS